MSRGYASGVSGRVTVGRWLWSSIAMLLLASSLRVASAGEATEVPYSPDNVKAAFLYHFGAYVQWPPESQRGEVFTIAVLGGAEVARELRQIVPGRTIQGRRVQVREIDSVSQLGDAQILFIGEQMNSRLEQQIRQVQNQPVLIVTDAPDGLRRGAAVNFTQVDRRVRFEVSLPAAERARLELSSRLLSVALNVERSGGVYHAPAEEILAQGMLRLLHVPGRRPANPGGPLVPLHRS